MHYTLEYLAGEPIILVTLSSDFDMSTDTSACTEVCLEILDAAAEPIVLIIDMTKATGSFSDFLPAMAAETRRERAIMRHPIVKRVILVSTRNLIRVAGRTLRQRQHDSLNVIVVDTVGEALEAARSTSR